MEGGPFGFWQIYLFFCGEVHGKGFSISRCMSVQEERSSQMPIGTGAAPNFLLPFMALYAYKEDRAYDGGVRVTPQLSSALSHCAYLLAYTNHLATMALPKSMDAEREKWKTN